MYTIDRVPALEDFLSRAAGFSVRVFRHIRFKLTLIALICTSFAPKLVQRKWLPTDFGSFVQPWYHNFLALGVRTPQNTIKTYSRNQELKTDVLFPMIKRALDILQRVEVESPKILEYFAADSYYGLYALTKAPENSRLLAVDLGEQSGESSKRANVLEQGLLIAKAVGLEHQFSQINQSVFEVNEPCDLILNIGGLYHVEMVEELMMLSANNGARLMIVQTVVHENRELESYFQTPAPNWSWGSRFSVDWIRNCILNLGWEIMEEDFNILDLNESPEDRGSVYFLCIR